MKVKLFNWRFRFDVSLRKLVHVVGINSNIDDSQQDHILLWDFDETPLNDICKSLLIEQRKWNLPTIHVVASSYNHFHAYCFSRTAYPLALHILSETKHVDTTFFKLGVQRGYWTLRITPKTGKQKFEYVLTLDSVVAENKALVNQLNLVKYVTGV